MAGLPAGHHFPAADCRIDIKRVNLDAISAVPGALGGEDRRAAAAKGIENDVAALRRATTQTRPMEKRRCKRSITGNKVTGIDTLTTITCQCRGPARSGS